MYVGWVGRLVDGWMDAWRDGWMGNWINRSIDGGDRIRNKIGIGSEKTG